MRVSLAFTAAVALLAAQPVFSLPAQAFPHVSLVAGRSATTEHRWTTSAFLNLGLDHGFSCHGLHFQPVGTLGWIKGRPAGRENLDHTVYVAGAGLRLVHWWHGAFASFQLGVTDGRTDALSSPGEFISSLGWMGRHWVVMVRHISNGNMFPGKNLGETMFLAGIRF